MQEAEVIIVGAGPAGASCAWALRQQQVEVLVLEKAVFPRLKPCAGWITPRVFSLLGILPEEYPHTLTHYSRFEIWIKSIHLRLRTHQYAIRRMEFDHWLYQRVASSVIHHQVRQIRQEEGKYIIDDQFITPTLIGAGGTGCPVSRQIFQQDRSAHDDSLIVAMEEEFRYPVSDPRCHLWFLQNGLPGYAWYVPKSDGYLNVGIGGSAAGLQARGDTLLHHWRLLQENLQRLNLVHGHEYQPSGHAYRLRARQPLLQKGNAYRIGDSLGLATLDMGEGIAAAIQSGILTAHAVLNQQPIRLQQIPRYSLPALIGRPHKTQKLDA